MLAGVVLTVVLGAAPAAWAHQCVDVEILQSPERAAAGTVLVVRGTATNCGDPARGFWLSWVLVAENGDRILLKKSVGQIEPGRTIAGGSRLMLPVRLRPGIYQLGFVGEAPSGFTDTDLVRLEITQRGTGR